MKKQIVIISLFLIFINFCKSYEKIPEKGCYQIEGIEGPEDFTIIENTSKLLITSLNRRMIHEGSVYIYDISKNKIRKIERLNEPPNFKLYPLGLDFYNQTVFIVFQGEKRESNWKTNGIAIYKWENEQLKFIKIFQNEKIFAPNDLKILSDEEFLITNDMKDRNSFMKAAFSLYLGVKKGSLVYCNISHNSCEYVDTELGFPNSIAFDKEKIYVSTTFEGKIYQYDFKEKKIMNKKILGEIPGADNLIIYNNNLYVASHPDLLKFNSHSKDTKNKSPSAGYRINLTTGEIQKIFSDDGNRMSASSVIVEIDNKILLGQVFDPFLLRCE